mmetsp:Transcript_18089/g.32796  ORF Transcript_18089/g.32796 Transcript_18089/m.32796 type:complete len:257 (-) Transcript_18089:1659-2429(-)
MRIRIGAIGRFLLTPLGPEKRHPPKVRNILLFHILGNQTTDRQLFLAHHSSVLVTCKSHQRRQCRGMAAELQKTVIHVGIRMADRYPQCRFILCRNPIGRIEGDTDIQFVFHCALCQETHGLQFVGIGRRLEGGWKSKKEGGGVCRFRFRETISISRGRWRRDPHPHMHIMMRSHSSFQMRTLVGTRTPFHRQHDIAHHGLSLQIGQTLRRFVVRIEIQECIAWLGGLIILIVSSPIHFWFWKAYADAAKRTKGIH